MDATIAMVPARLNMNMEIGLMSAQSDRYIGSVLMCALSENRSPDVFVIASECSWPGKSGSAGV